MSDQPNLTFFQKVKATIIGKGQDPHDPKLFHKLSLVTFFAWVGLGSDGLSSSCYGPEEAFLALQGHISLGIFIAIATAVTIFVISACYTQIIEMFPTGGGGYVVASKLLSPSLGMISGCALLIDYLLTIVISIASGVDALFSSLPLSLSGYKLEFALFMVIFFTILNMRGVKESVGPLVPIFLTFIVTHVIIIVYVLVSHFADFGVVAQTTMVDMESTQKELGFAGMMILLFRAYAMGAGTFTGIEAVSNGMPFLREPRVKTAKKTMTYMAFSLAFMAVGLMLGYIFFRLDHQPGKTLNAVLLEVATANWSQPQGSIFVLVTLLSETFLLFIAAQTGFFGGPRVLANMALDRWFPTQFTILSERYVIQNGILLMGGASLLFMFFSKGSVKFLVVLYSITVFITFFLSLLGMTLHWWKTRKVGHWKRKICVSGFGLLLTTIILIGMIGLKFDQGGWITLLVTGALIILAIAIKRHYNNTYAMLKRLDTLINAAEISNTDFLAKTTSPNLPVAKLDPQGKTAVILVSGYNGLGLHTLFNVIRLFGDNFKNYLFIEVGIIDVGNFKGVEEIDGLDKHIKEDLDRYVKFMQGQGFYAEGFSSIGTDLIEEIRIISTDIYQRFPQSVFFGGQLVFPKDTLLTKILHNHTTFAVQRKLYQEGISCLIMPIRVT